jgi:hypothetical protein
LTKNRLLKLGWATEADFKVCVSCQSLLSPCIRAILMRRCRDAQKIDKDVRAQADADVEFAKNSKVRPRPAPCLPLGQRSCSFLPSCAQELPPSELYTDVYVDAPPPFIRAPDITNSVRAA